MLGSDLHLVVSNCHSLAAARALTELFERVSVEYRVSNLSDVLGKSSTQLDKMVKESKVVFLGEVDLLESGFIESLVFADSSKRRIFFAVPTEIEFAKALNNLPLGMAILTSGFNEENFDAGIINNALSIIKTIVEHGHWGIHLAFEKLRKELQAKQVAVEGDAA